MGENQITGGKGLQPHEVRVVEERTELLEKITKLHAFMASKFYQTLAPLQHTYFERQEKAMIEYCEVLLERINSFAGKMENTIIKPTFGQLAVGYKFNPSNQSDVDIAKKLMADAIDLLEDAHNVHVQEETVRLSWTRNVLRTSTFNAIRMAQMELVKYLTWRD
jgi:hypothetical protein